jgi:hypothetical protein
LDFASPHGFWVTFPMIQYEPMHAPHSLSAAIKDYMSCHKRDADKELRWFEIQPSFDKALSFAAYAKGPSGKKFSHQHRIPLAVLEESYGRLKSCQRELLAASSFEELHQIISDQIRGIRGVGLLLVYDTALRLGANLKLKPSVVFLHAGTREGARRLGLNAARAFIPPSEFPPALRKLPARQIEDILCIYKNWFGDSDTIITRAPICYK